MFSDKLKKYKILLASKSPRRHYLLKEAGIEFDVVNDITIEENFPLELDKFKIPIFLSEKKAEAYTKLLSENTILITADTIVWFNGYVINKPSDSEDAVKILSKLSANMHEVITGVTIRTKNRKYSFYSHSEVFFGPLSDEEIHYYVKTFKPFDKAGAYGIQEWIGYIGIEKINGSFFNVMGLPIHQLYRELEKFISEM